MNPTNLDEAIELISKQLLTSDDNINNLLNVSEKDFTINNHQYFGRIIRNNWKLWEKTTPIVKWFNEKGIFHADDMSAIILTSFHRKINNVDIDLDNQIKFYIDYWNENDPDVNLGKY